VTLLPTTHPGAEFNSLSSSKKVERLREGTFAMVYEIAPTSRYIPGNRFARASTRESIRFPCKLIWVRCFETKRPPADCEIGFAWMR